MRMIHNPIMDMIYSITIFAVFVIMCFVVDAVYAMPTLASSIMTLGVFLISLSTEGYLYGIIFSFLSVLAINFAFTFPFFRFNFSIWENVVSAIIMLIVTILTSALATKVLKQEKLRAETEKERMRANLLRAVSHDLRTPLTSIYGSSSAIVDKLDKLSDEQILTLARGIQEDSAWLVRMVENLLSITKIDSSNVKLEKKETVLEELIDLVLIKFKKRYPKQKIEIDIPEEFLMVPMDAMLIEQVITNMLENAVHHAVGMTRLILKVSVVGENAVFEIIDDGCGIPREHLKDVFKGYYENRENHIDNNRNNMGIGLSVCATIIKAHGGTISVENRKGGGCIFRFTLELEREEHDEQV